MSENFDQTSELMRELFQAERQQEITQIMTLQGQIVALVLLLKDTGILQKKHIERWETLSEHVSSLLNHMAHANDVGHLEELDRAEALTILIAGLRATIEFSRLMGNPVEALQGLWQEYGKLTQELKDLRNET